MRYALDLRNWFKGADTVSILAYMEDRIGKAIDQVEPTVRGYFRNMHCLIREANQFMKTLYRAALWLDANERQLLLKSGRLFLEKFQLCANKAYHLGITRWKIQPKYHMFGEVLHELETQERASIQSLNPLCFSTQMDEDLVGQVCSRSRVVSSRTIHERTLGRYKVALCCHW